MFVTCINFIFPGVNNCLCFFFLNKGAFRFPLTTLRHIRILISSAFLWRHLTGTPSPFQSRQEPLLDLWHSCYPGISKCSPGNSICFSAILDLLFIDFVSSSLGLFPCFVRVHYPIASNTRELMRVSCVFVLIVIKKVGQHWIRNLGLKCFLCGLSAILPIYILSSSGVLAASSSSSPNLLTSWFLPL